MRFNKNVHGSKNAQEGNEKRQAAVRIHPIWQHRVRNGRQLDSLRKNLFFYSACLWFSISPRCHPATNNLQVNQICSSTWLFFRHRRLTFAIFSLFFNSESKSKWPSDIVWFIYFAGLAATHEGRGHIRRFFLFRALSLVNLVNNNKSTGRFPGCEIVI